MTKYFFILCITSLLIYQNIIYAQGCSDAGICTTGALNPENDGERHSYLQHKFTIDYMLYYQQYKKTHIDQGVTLGINYHFTPRSSFQLKTAYALRQSPLTSVSGIGDFTFAYSYALYQSERWQIATVIGTKVPTSDASATMNGLPLPMFYNTSLGTYDGLFGIAISSKAWHFSLGIQQPLTTLENHKYDPDYWANQPNYLWMKNWYTSSRHLSRKTDLSGRFKYTLRTSKWTLSPSILAIYKVEKAYIESLENGDYLLEGSDGITINALLEGSYNFTPHLSIGAIAAIAVQQRSIIPEGLARDYVFNLLIKHQF